MRNHQMVQKHGFFFEGETVIAEPLNPHHV